MCVSHISYLACISLLTIITISLFCMQYNLWSLLYHSGHPCWCI